MSRELPFKCMVLDEPEEVSNIFTGEAVMLPADAVAVYDVLMGTQMLAEKSGLEEHWQIVRDGLDWFRKHEPRACGTARLIRWAEQSAHFFFDWSFVQIVFLLYRKHGLPTMSPVPTPTRTIPTRTRIILFVFVCFYARVNYC